ncbi:MAG: DUF262 domain-containing protein [Lachnospiraceae bacterium]|jgi:uncharacterized protein with ParB-like and HNH nuclease domain|nr:DUF262 domain-containing protein [Lachnospiraceae bacterium]
MTGDIAHNLKSSEALSIGQIIKNRIFRVPMYQRNYKWGTKTAGKLAEDLADSYGKDMQKSIGLLTLHQGDREILDIIDGQQRFITLSIIFSILCGQDMPIQLSFERDGADRERIAAIHREYDEKWSGSSPDADRIMRNKEKIKEILEKKEILEEGEKEAFQKYILEKCMMLCSIIETEPEKEFMNLNAYKTKFSVCDYVRANLISLNTFYRGDLDKKNSILASCLEKHSYKTAIARLYDDILDIFYSDSKCDGTYKNVYSLVRGSYFDPDKTEESRINILFTKELSDKKKRDFSDEISDKKKGYFSDEIHKDGNKWIEILLKIACVKKLMSQLKQEMEGHNFSSAKGIDDYQKLKKENFLDLIMNLDVEKERLDTITLAKLLKENSNVGYVLMKDLGKTDLKLANRYFEAFVYSGVNRATVTAAEVENDRVELPKMSDEEIISCIQGAGQEVIDRFLQEQKQAAETSVVIAPVLDLEDRENLDFGGELDLEEGDTITAGKLFAHKRNIKVPVIQRDYCMGARINKTEADDFLGYLIKNFQEGKEVVASTILIAVEKNTADIYIFDGQQRLYTIYQLLKHCGICEEDNARFIFIGRKNGASKYSEIAERNLKEAFEERTQKIEGKKGDFGEYLRNNVRFKLKITGTISDAEQFFMDINGGVSLKKYEIFKACLCERLVDLGETDFIREMENKWLEWFYRFFDIKKTDEEDMEELAEMRFLEFLCRFFAMRMQEDHGENSEKRNEKLPAFDCMESKSQLVGRLEYLNKLSREDISRIRCVMDYLMDHEAGIKTPSEQGKMEIEFYHKGNINLGSTVKQCIGYYLLEQHEVQKEKFIGRHKDAILHGFINSLSDKTRIQVQRFYSWKDVGALIEIYDKDLLLNDCIRHILKIKPKAGEGKYPYAEKEDISMHFLGGYKVWENMGKIPITIEGIPKEEIPAYYKMPFTPGGNYIRAKYIYDYNKVISDNSEVKTLTFIWTKKREEKSIKREDGVDTNIVFSNKLKNPYIKDLFGTKDYCIVETEQDLIIGWLTYRTDAYFLNSAQVWYQDLI